MSTIVNEPRTAAVWSGLRQFAALPDWLNAATDPAEVSRALARIVPELASGKLAIGDSHEVASIDGVTRLAGTAAPAGAMSG